MLPLQCQMRSPELCVSFLFFAQFFWRLKCSQFGGSFRVGFSKVRDPSGSRVFPINKGRVGWTGGMNDNDRIFEAGLWDLNVFFCSCLGSGAIVSWAFTGSGWFFLGGFGRVGVGLRSLVIGLWGWLKVLFQHSSLGIFEVPRVATWQGSLGNPTKPSTS